VIVAVIAGVCSSSAAYTVWTVHCVSLSVLCRRLFHDVWSYCLQLCFLAFPRWSKGQSRI